MVTNVLQYFSFPLHLTGSVLPWEVIIPSNSSISFIPLQSFPIRQLLVPSQLTWTWTLITLLILLILVFHYGKSNLTRRARFLNKLPGARCTIPFLGHSYVHLGPSWRTQQVFSNYVKRYGKVSKFWHFGEPQVLISDVKVVEKILGSPDLFEKATGYENLKDFGGVGLVTSSGDRWKRDRKAFNYAFNRQLFDGFIAVFDCESKKLLTILETRFQKFSKPQNLYPSLLTAAIDMVYQAAIGVKLNVQEEGQDNIYSKGIHTLMSSSHIRLFKPHIYRTPFLYRLLGKLQAEKEAFANLIQACVEPMSRKRMEMKNVKETEKRDGITQKTKPFLDILMEQTPQPTLKEYGEHLGTIIGAGAETTASSIHMTLFFLAHYPDHQRKVQDEIDTIMGPDRTSNKELTWADLCDAKYLEMCWKESMRLRPSVPLLGRRLTRDVKLDDGSILAKDVDAVILIHDLHRDPDIWERPEEFDPLRFSADNSAQRSAYSYIPFSAGNRNCIGLRYAEMEAKTTLIHILSKFNIKTKQKQEDIKVIFGVPGIPYPAIELILEQRVQNKV